MRRSIIIVELMILGCFEVYICSSDEKIWNDKQNMHNHRLYEQK